jgi:hypothetical protein
MRATSNRWRQRSTNAEPRRASAANSFRWNRLDQGGFGGPVERSEILGEPTILDLSPALSAVDQSGYNSL